MPVFTVGLGHATVLSNVLNVPLYETSHQQGHVAAGLLGHQQPEEAFVALHLSGGTTELLACKNGKLTLLGGCADLHAGQVVDRVGVAMGLPFPAGPHLEKLAVQGRSEARLTMTTRDGGLNCHLSGAETQVQRWIQSGELSREDIAREVYDLLSRTVARMICAGAEKTGIKQVLIAGGVSSSALFRELVTERIHKRDRELRVCFGKPEYSGDNAVGTALIGAQMLRESEK